MGYTVDPWVFSRAEVDWHKIALVMSMVLLVGKLVGPATPCQPVVDRFSVRCFLEV